MPVLRLLEVDGGHTTSTAERSTREIDVHGGVTNWYIEVSNPPHSFRVELGYKSAGGRFFSLCRSNIVHTPAPDSGDVIDENWTDVAANYERVYALSGGYAEDNQSGELQELFEERLRRPMGQPIAAGQFGSGAERVLNRHRDLDFHVDAEMILYGRTKPDAKVTLGGEPIKLRPDGSFTVRQPMPDKRQVLPVVASTPDGVEQRTIVIAVERATPKSSSRWSASRTIDFRHGDELVYGVPGQGSPFTPQARPLPSALDPRVRCLSGRLLLWAIGQDLN